MDKRHLKIKGLQEQQRSLKGKLLTKNQSLKMGVLDSEIARPGVSLKRRKVAAVRRQQRGLKSPRPKTIKNKLLY